MTCTSIWHMQERIGANSWERISVTSALRSLSEELDRTPGVMFDPLGPPTITLAEAKDRVRKMTSELDNARPKYYMVNVVVTYGSVLVCFFLLVWLMVSFLQITEAPGNFRANPTDATFCV
ncbi:hypothetical protein ACP275_02G076300 [Erythranthe tilingii]